VSLSNVITASSLFAGKPLTLANLLCSVQIPQSAGTPGRAQEEWRREEQGGACEREVGAQRPEAG